MKKFDIGLFRAKWPDFGFFSRKEILGFLRVCSDTASTAHKEALELLLYPDGVELSSYYVNLGSFLNTLRIRTRDIPRPLLQIFCELLASAGKIPQGNDGREFLVSLLSKIPPNLLVWLFDKRFPLRPFIHKIEVKRIFRGNGEPSKLLRKRWRLLRKRVLSSSSAARSLQDPGLETTVSDLGFVTKAGRRPAKVKSEWRIHGKAVVSKVAVDQAGAPAQPLKHLYWGGMRSRGLAFWEKLVRAQAGELTEIRRLATGVSSRTGRVVLSWHNASLGAAGGWAFEDVAAQFAHPAHFSLFSRRFSKRLRKFVNRSTSLQPRAFPI